MPYLILMFEVQIKSGINILIELFNRCSFHFLSLFSREKKTLSICYTFLNFFTCTKKLPNISTFCFPTSQQKPFVICNTLAITIQQIYIYFTVESLILHVLLSINFLNACRHIIMNMCFNILIFHLELKNTGRWCYECFDISIRFFIKLMKISQLLKNCNKQISNIDIS